MYRNGKEALWAAPVDSKGEVDDAVTWCVEKLGAVGYHDAKIFMKSDQVRAIMALRRALAARRVGETAPIGPPVRESSQMERAACTWQSQMRTCRHDSDSYEGGSSDRTFHHSLSDSLGSGRHPEIPGAR